MRTYYYYRNQQDEETRNSVDLSVDEICDLFIIFESEVSPLVGVHVLLSDRAMITVMNNPSTYIIQYTDHVSERRDSVLVDNSLVMASLRRLLEGGVAIADLHAPPDICVLESKKWDAHIDHNYWIWRRLAAVDE